MVAAGDVRKGVTIEYNGNVYVVVEFQHVKPGKGAAFVRTNLSKLLTRLRSWKMRTSKQRR